MDQRQRETDLTETSPLSKEGGGEPATAPPPPEARVTLKEAEDAVQEAAKGSTNVDTLVSKLVVDQGLATQEEVQHCLEKARQMREEQNQASLVQLLVDNEYVTKRQITRLR